MKKIIVISFVFLFCILFIFIEDNRNLTHIESSIKDINYYINIITVKPFKHIIEEIKLIKESKKIQKKYNDLEIKYEKLKLEVNKTNEYQKELEDLKKLSNLKNSLIDYDTEIAYIIRRNIKNWNETIIIDKGSKNGLKKGMAVIYNSTLIGIITKITKNTSTIKLLSGFKSRISVKIEVGDNYIYGLLDGYDKYYMVKNVDNVDIPKGSIVTTTGLDNIFPSGLEIGKVEKRVLDSFELEQTVYVKTIDLDNLNYVLVIKRNLE